MTFRGEFYLEHGELTEVVEIQGITESFLTQFFSPSRLHVVVTPFDGLWPEVPAAPDLATDLATLEKGVGETPVAEGAVNEPKPGPPLPGSLTFNEYYAAFADMTFRALQALFHDPKNWMHTWRGGWTQIDGHFRSPNMVVPERFGLVIILGEKALTEAQKRLADSSSLEVVQ